MSIIQNSFIIVVGNTFNIKDGLKKYGFHFIYDSKAWYKIASEDTLRHWEKAIANESITVGHVTTLDDIRKIADLHKEAMALQKEECGTKTVQTAIESHLTGKVIEVSKWYANVFAKDRGVEIAFRNIKVLSVYRETEKAVLADVEFFAGVSVSCGICGRPLSNQISKATGIGPICAEKFGLPRVTKVNAKEIVAALNQKCAQLGIFKEVWIAKSQIQRVVDIDTLNQELSSQAG